MESVQHKETYQLPILNAECEPSQPFACCSSELSSINTTSSIHKLTCKARKGRTQKKPSISKKQARQIVPLKKENLTYFHNFYYFERMNRINEWIDSVDPNAFYPTPSYLNGR